ncbi:MAG: heme exporter protein CcmD [Erythrobacter sp.]|nr:heme exporter protein CcmD [Erythrobacter sp.]MDJ0977213.1 heme exporter protein CcmD [Erythrobacter sp.]
MRESLPQWDYVLAAYAVMVLAMAAMIAWSWLAMRRAEKRRDAVKRR